jgi:hypothetical protein
VSPAAVSLLALLQQADVLGSCARKPELTHRLTQATPWLRGRLAVVTRKDGTLRTCRHVRPGESRWLLLWHPREVVCHRCSLALHEAIVGGVEDRRCDVCGRIGEQGIWPFVVGGPDAVVIVGGTCRSCRPIVTAGWGEAE